MYLMSARKILLCSAFVAFLPLAAGAQKKADKKALAQITADVEYLASDEMEGRRTASEGERKAAAYIISRYEKEQIPAFKGAYRHPFPFIYGKEIASSSAIVLGGQTMNLKEQAFPVPFSANTTHKLHSEVLPDVLEQGNIWLLSLYADQGEADDMHFEWEKAMYERAKDAKKQGATAVVFYDSYNSKYAPTFERMSETEPLDVPVAFVNYETYEQRIRNRTEGVDIDLSINIKKSEFTGTNVAAYIDNKAANTVVIGAHYDHLGYGEDGNSTYRGKDKAIHNGADDNASGTAGLMQLASWIKAKKLHKYNYLFVHFSGEELGLYGSKAFVKELGKDTSDIAYMINMDMIGRLNDSTHALTLGGIGTSPAWEPYVAKPPKYFRMVLDSAGVGPSDHTSFYYAGIPVLFLFTGTHHDYHKPSDDADKVNYPGELEVLKYAYSIVETMEKKPLPAFTATRQSTVGKVHFKVTMGIMPDYSFNDGGVRVDGVTEGKPASKAGVQAGDVITQMGEYKVNGMQSYMETLGKLSAGQTVDVTVLRGGKPVKLQVTF
jgi:aminopeptidase YwaD